MDALDVLEVPMIRRERVFRDHGDFLAHDDDWLIRRFRFTRAVFLDLCVELCLTGQHRAIPVHIQELTTFGFLATGSFQQGLADRHVFDMINNI